MAKFQQLDALELLSGPEGYWYLASPYTHPDPEVRHTRVEELHEIMAHLLANRIIVYAPIWASHRAADEHELPIDQDWWAASNRAFMRPAAGLLVADIDGWQESKGVAYERNFCENKPAFLVGLVGGIDGRKLLGMTPL